MQSYYYIEEHRHMPNPDSPSPSPQPIVVTVSTTGSLPTQQATTLTNRQIRYRINVEHNSRGNNWECTVEGVGYSRDTLLRFSDDLVEKLNQRYSSPDGDRNEQR